MAVFNWEGEPQVVLNLDAVLIKGQRFMVLDAQDYFGKLLLEGTWQADPVAVPLPASVVLSGDAIGYSCRGQRQDTR